MYKIDYKENSITKIINGKEYTKFSKNSRDIIKYRIYSCKLLLSYLNKENIILKHFIPLEMHNFIIENKKEKITDLNILKNYFLNLIKILSEKLPDFSILINNNNNNKNLSSITLYKLYEKIFIKYTNLNPKLIGMAFSLESFILISIEKKKYLDYNIIKNILENNQFNIDFNKNLNIKNLKIINLKKKIIINDLSELILLKDYKNDKIIIKKNLLENLIQFNNYLIERNNLLEFIINQNGLYQN